MGPSAIGELKSWPARVAAVTSEKYSYEVRGREVSGENYSRRH